MRPASGEGRGPGSPHAGLGRRLAGTEDPFLLAQAVDRAGDLPIVALLDDDTAPVDARLGAVRGARYLADPVRGRAALMALAGGRDPDLAPAAVRTLRAWSRDPLARRSLQRAHPDRVGGGEGMADEAAAAGPDAAAPPPSLEDLLTGKRLRRDLARALRLALQSTLSEGRSK